MCPDLQLLSWSKGAERMFGWNAPDVVGKRLSELRWIHDEDAEVFATLVDEMLADKQPRDMRMHRTFHRNGAVLECEWYFSRSEEHTSELQSLMRISYAVFC